MFKLKNIRGYRKLKCMSQEDLAWEIGMESASVISRIELGDYNNSLKVVTLVRMAEVLGVSLFDLIEQ